MTIQYCSDLHLEFSLNKEYVKHNPLNPLGEILLLAGDIIPFSEIERVKEFFDFISDNFKQCYWVPGNHEYYRSDIQLRGERFEEKIRSNVTLVNNCAIQYNGVRLLMSTLWSSISPKKERVITRSMADFRLIKNGDQKLSVEDFNRMHNDCKHFLTTELLQQSNEQKTVVVTHHIPTYMNYPEKFKGDDLNEAFAVELFDLIEASKASFWISGHSHEVVPDFQIGVTTLTSNQLGYVEHGEHLKFDYAKCIRI
jgi:predicted phosphohydrolase